MCLVPKFVAVNSWQEESGLFIISGLLIDNPPAVIACL